jgi:hypothetical protein
LLFFLGALLADVHVEVWCLLWRLGVGVHPNIAFAAYMMPMTIIRIGNTAARMPIKNKSIEPLIAKADNMSIAAHSLMSFQFMAVAPLLLAWQLWRRRSWRHR